MLELPEALTVARQINETIGGKRIVRVTAAHSPHKFAWFHGDPLGYHALLAGKTVGKANGYGCLAAEIPKRTYSGTTAAIEP